MTFKQFAILIAVQFTEITKEGILFNSSFRGDALWDLYLKSFKPELNKD